MSKASQYGSESGAKSKTALAVLGKEADLYFARENYVQLTTLLKEHRLRSKSTTERGLIGELRQEASRLLARRQEILHQFKAGDVVVPLVHGQWGCVRFLSFAKQPSAASPHPESRLAEDSKRAVEMACLAVVKLVASELRVPPPMPRSYYSFKLCGCDDANTLEIADRSLALPAALAFFSAWSGKPIPAGLVATGAIDPETLKILTVSGVQEKFDVLSRELTGWFKVLLAPRNNQGSSPQGSRCIVEVETLQEAFDRIWGKDWRKIKSKILDLSTALKDAEEEYYGGNNQAARIAFANIVELCGPQRETRWIKFSALWRRGSAETHLGMASDAKQSLLKAEKLGRQLFRQNRISADKYYGCLISQAVCLDDKYDFAAALETVEKVIEYLRNLNPTPEVLEGLGRAVGTKAQILLHVRQLGAAERCYVQSIKAFNAFQKSPELPRSYCWLAIVQGERGNLAGADRSFQQAEEKATILNPSGPHSQYFVYAHARISVRTRRYERCVEGIRATSTAPNWPIALALRYRAESFLELEKLEDCLEHCKRSEEIFSSLEIRETLAPLAAQPHFVAAAVYSRCGDKEATSTELGSAISLLSKHRSAFRYFQPFLHRVRQSQRNAQFVQAVSQLLKKMPY